MRYCQNCGKELNEGAQFCSHCGQNTHTVSHTEHQKSRGNRIHCPRCKSMQLSPVVETQTTGGTAVHTPLTRKTSMTTYSSHSIHRNYWMCQSCGHKFRNLENLQEELAEKERIVKLCTRVMILLGVFLLLFLVTDLWLWSLILFVPVELFLVAYLLSEKNQIKKMTALKKHLSKHCFD